MADKDLEAAAARIREAFAGGAPCDPVRDLIPEGDLDAAYRVQDINTETWITEGRKLSGRKIGLTAKAVQKQLGVDQPDYGVLFADMCFGDGEEIPHDRVLQPRVEAEIAFVLDHDLSGENLTIVDVMNAVAYAVASIEVADSRIKGWDITILDTIADNASAGIYVLGATPVKIGDFDLRMCGMVLEHNGEPISTGAGAACLGNPLNSVLWLARKMVQVGRPLRQGDLVMSGALGPMVAAAPGGVYECRINGLGSVRAVFGAGD